MSEDKKELLPCPFCGKEASVFRDIKPMGIHEYSVTCDSCCSQGCICDNEESAIKGIIYDKH